MCSLIRRASTQRPLRCSVRSVLRLESHGGHGERRFGCGQRPGCALRSAGELTMNIISIGEVLWDVFGDTEHLGGAAFNFGAHAKILGHSVSFISAVGEDQRGRRILERMEAMGLPTRYRPPSEGSPHRDSHRQPRHLRPAAFHHPPARCLRLPRSLGWGPRRTFISAGLTGFTSERCFR